MLYSMQLDGVTPLPLECTPAYISSVGNQNMKSWIPRYLAGDELPFPKALDLPAVGEDIAKICKLKQSRKEKKS